MEQIIENLTLISSHDTTHRPPQYLPHQQELQTLKGEQALPQARYKEY